MKNTDGFTIIECIISLVALSVIFTGVLTAINAAVAVGFRADTAQGGGVLLEGVMAEARAVAYNEIINKTDLWDIIKDTDAGDRYELTLMYKDIQTDGIYPFTNSGGLQTYDALYSFTPSVSAVQGRAYDLNADETTPPVIINDTGAASFHILANLQGGDILSVENKGAASVFVDIYGDGDVLYQGGGILIKTYLPEREPDFIITGAVYTKDGEFVNAIVSAR